MDGQYQPLAKARRRNAPETPSAQLRAYLHGIAWSVSGKAAADAAWRRLRHEERRRAVLAALDRCRASGSPTAGPSTAPPLFASEDLALCYRELGGAVGLWMAAREVEMAEAVVDLAETVQLIAGVTAAEWRDALRAAAATAPPDAAAGPEPHWDGVHGCLYLGDELVRRVRDTTNGTIAPVLAAFEKAGWPRAIDSPLKSKSSLKEAVKNLNRSQGPATIRFAVRGNGYRVQWMRIAPGDRTPL